MKKSDDPSAIKKGLDITGQVKSSQEECLMAAAIRVLYVDDEPDLLGIGKLFLEDSGDFIVTTELSAPDAIRLLEQEKFDAIVSDYQMPGMDGIQFLVEVRSRFGPIPFILFTGRGREEVVIQALNSGADFYLQKGGEPGAQFAELRHKIKVAAFSKRADDALRKSEEKYRQLVDLAQEGIWAIDANGNTTYVNRLMAEMLGYSVEDMLGAHLFSFMDDAGKTIAAENMERRRQGIKEDHDFEFITKRGNRIFAHLSTSPITDEKGVYLGALAVVTDITERKQAENALRESHIQLTKSEADLQIHKTELMMQAEELRRTNLILEDSRDKYLDLYEFSPVGYFTLSDKALITESNLTGAKIFGVERSKLVKARFSKFVAEKDAGEWHWYFMNVLNQKEKRTCTLMLKQGDGSLFPAQLEAILIPHSDGVNTVRIAIIDITGIRRVEEVLKSSEERYRAIYEQSPIAIELYNAAGALVHVNPACLKIFGVENMQVLHGFSLFADPNITDEQKDKLHQGETVRYQGPFDFEKVKALNLYPTSREGVIWLDVLITPLGNRADSITGFLVQIQDITERKRLEKAHRESEERFRLITETIDETFWMADVEIGKIFYVSSGFERIWGFSKESLYKNSRSFLDAIHKDDRERVLADLEIEKTGQPFDHEYRIVLPDGNIRNIWDRGFPIRDEKGQISIYAGIAIDITESKLAEEALRGSEERFRGIYDTITSGVAIYEVKNDGASGKDYIIKDFNKTALEIEGKKKEEVVGKSLFDLRPTIDEYGLIPVFQQVWKTGVPAYFPQKVYIDEKYSSWYENRVFRLQSGEIVAVYDDVTERKKSEESLRESEEKYRTLVEKANEAIMIAQDEVFVFANSRMSELLGVPAGKLEGKPFVDFIWPEDRDWVVANYRKRISGETISDAYEFRIIGAGGRLTWVYLSAAAIQWKGKTATLNLVSDITERKRAEEALQESEEKFRDFFNNAGDAIAIHDLQGRFLEVNDVFCRRLGYSREELLEMSPVDIDDPEYSERVQDRIHELQQAGHIIFDTVHLGKDGIRIPTEVSSRMITYSREPAVISMGRDITERKRAEVALKESEERFKSYIDNSPDGIFISDERGCYLEVNPAACRITGYKKEELLVMHIYDLLPPESQEAGVKHFKELIECGHSFGELLFRHKDGSLRYWSVDAVRLTSTRFIGFVKDITKRKVAEESLRVANKKLKLLSGITRHDINNQMTVLQGYLTILQKKQPDPSLTEYFLKVSTAAQRISSMIQFTREYENIGINAPVWQNCRTLVDTASKQVPLGQVVVKNDFPAGAEVFADPLVVKVFYNLMDNAVRYGGKITTIRFFVEEHDGDHIVVCEDDGEGVVAKEKEKIFERGFGKNTGLGLALSREILDITGITIKETGEPGKGARFEMTIPKVAYRIGSVQ